MNFNEYQKKAIKTLRNNKNSKLLKLARLTLGISGESGEIAEKVKKFLRDSSMDKMDWWDLKWEIASECGDLLWYIATLHELLELDLNETAENNIKKLKSRQKRGKIEGSGDNR